jgi:hypothetical protein
VALRAIELLVILILFLYIVPYSYTAISRECDFFYGSLYTISFFFAVTGVRVPVQAYAYLIVNLPSDTPIYTLLYHTPSVVLYHGRRYSEFSIILHERDPHRKVLDCFTTWDEFNRRSLDVSNEFEFDVSSDTATRTRRSHIIPGLCQSVSPTFRALR